MKNLYDTIEQNLKAGLYVVVKDSRDNSYSYSVISKDYDGNFRDSSWCDSIQIAKKNIGLCNGYSKDYWNNLDLEIVEVFRPEYEPFKVGDKVELLDSIKETEDWGIIGKYFPNMTGEIKEACFEASGTYYNVNGWHIGHEYLAPLNEVKEETIKIGDHTYFKSEVEKRLQGLKEI